MKKVRITMDGVALTGPACVQLTHPQFEAQARALGGIWRRGGVFDLGAGQSLTFAAGDVLSVDDPASALPEGAFEAVGWRMPPARDTAATASKPRSGKR